MSLGELYDDLEAHLTAERDGEANVGGFIIDNLERADWAARKVARARRQLAAAELLAEDEKQRIDDWLENERARCESDTAFLVDQLQRYHRSVLDEDSQRKTIALPGGAQLVARKHPDSLVVEDEAAALSWCEANLPDAVVVSKKLDKPTLKRTLTMPGIDHATYGCAVTSDGEVVTGLRFQPGEVSFRVKTDEAGE